jgi:hypothetical protein
MGDELGPAQVLCHALCLAPNLVLVWAQHFTQRLSKFWSKHCTQYSTKYGTQCFTKCQPVNCAVFYSIDKQLKNPWGNEYECVLSNRIDLQ